MYIYEGLLEECSAIEFVLIFETHLHHRGNLSAQTNIRILPNGTGWVYLRNEWQPATFYMEDILYRLDLQGKLP